MGRGLSIVPASDSSHSPSAIPSRSLDYSFKLITHLIPSGMKVYTGLSSAEAFSPLSKSQVFILPPTCRHSCSGGFDWNATDDTHESYVLRSSYCNESMLATMFPLQKSCWHMLIHSMHPVRLRCLTLTINEGSMYRKCPTRS